MDLPDLTLVVDGTTAVVPAIAVTLHLDGADGEGILDFYERSRALLGDRLTHYVAESMKRRAKITARAETMVPSWVKSPREEKGYHAFFTGCDDAGGVTAASLEFAIHWRPVPAPEVLERRRRNWRTLSARGTVPFLPMSTLRVSLPLDHPLSRAPEEFRAWVLDLALVRRGSFVSGGCGPAIVHYSAAGSAEVRALMDARIASICRRYPGLGWRVPDAALRNLLRWDPALDDIASQLTRVSWLTLVGDRIVARLGGREAIGAALAAEPAIRMHEAGGGLAVCAGEAPELGDLGKHDLLPLQRRVAAALRPARMPTLRYPGERPEGWAQEWLDMFDVEHG